MQVVVVISAIMLQETVVTTALRLNFELNNSVRLEKKAKKKIEVSEVFDAERAPPLVLVTWRHRNAVLWLQPSDFLYQPKTTNLNEP